MPNSSANGRQKISVNPIEEEKVKWVASASSENSNQTNNQKSNMNQLECESELSESDLMKSSKSAVTRRRKYNIRPDVVKKTIFRSLKKYYSGSKEIPWKEQWIKSVNFVEFRDEVSKMLRWFNNAHMDAFLRK